MEERISKWITNIVGGSYVIAVLVLALIWLIVAIANGDFDILYSSTTVKFTITGVLYVVSLYLVGTLPGKPLVRRQYSWLFSIVFHSGLLVYIGFVFDIGSAAMVIGLAETIILVLSIIGLCLCVHNKHQNEV